MRPNILSYAISFALCMTFSGPVLAQTDQAPVDEAEDVRHDVTDVGQAEQHERDAQRRVGDAHQTSPKRLWSDVAIACKYTARCLWSYMGMRGLFGCWHDLFAIAQPVCHHPPGTRIHTQREEKKTRSETCIMNGIPGG